MIRRTEPNPTLIITEGQDLIKAAIAQRPIQFKVQNPILLECLKPETYKTTRTLPRVILTNVTLNGVVVKKLKDKVAQAHQNRTITTIKYAFQAGNTYMYNFVTFSP